MAIRVPLLSPKQIHLLPNFPTNSQISSAHISYPPRNQSIAIACTNPNTNDGFSDAELALKLGAEVEKLKAHMTQREEALNRSRELLFKELSSHLGLETEEVKGKWRTMSDDDKLAVSKEFLSGWSDDFHPLSARSAIELIDQHLSDEINVKPSADSASASPAMFPSFRRFIGF